MPKLMRGFGHYAGKLRRAASDFRALQFEEAMRESEIEEVRKAIESAQAAPLDLDAPSDKPVIQAGPSHRQSRWRRASVRAKLPPRARRRRSAFHEPRAKATRTSRNILVELRRRLVWSLLAVFLAFLVCFWFAKPIYNLLWPYRLAAGTDAPIELIYTAPQEFFFTKLRLALFGALFLAFPVIASQVYMFVAPGLYKNERQAFLPFLIATPILHSGRAARVFRRHAAGDDVLSLHAADHRTGTNRTQRKGQRISDADHGADARLRHLLPVAGGAHAARA